MRGYLRFLFWATVIVGGILGLFYVAVFDVWTLPDNDPALIASVKPTLEPGDVLLVTKNGMPGYGHLVRCTDPDAPGRFVVGRILGVPDDVVEIKGERLFINNKGSSTSSTCEQSKWVVRRPGTDEDVELACSRKEFAGLTLQTLFNPAKPDRDYKSKVEANRVVLISDNYHLHLDSRDFGQVDPATCKHIVYRLWGATGFGDSKRRLSVIW